MYIEILRVSHKRLVRNQDVCSAVGGGKGQGQRHPSPSILHADGSIVSLVLIDFAFVVQGVRTHVVATTVCTTGGCAHTSRRTRISFGCTLHSCSEHCPSVVTLHLAQGHVKKVCGCFAQVINLDIFFFSTMFRPSPPIPSVLFPHGQRDWSAVSDIFSDLPGTPTRVSTCLATWPKVPTSQVMSPTSPTR